MKSRPLQKYILPSWHLQSLRAFLVAPNKNLDGRTHVAFYINRFMALLVVMILGGRSSAVEVKILQVEGVVDLVTYTILISW